MTQPGEPTWETSDTVERELGKAEVADADDDHPVAVLWVPDVEQRHGWREYYVKRQPKPKGRKMGYQK